MASILTFLRPLRPHRIKSILMVQSAPLDLTLKALESLRAQFPQSSIEGLICEEDSKLLPGDAFDGVTIVRWEDRFEVLKRLRAKRYHAVAAVHSKLSNNYLQLLPYLLRTRQVLVVNENLDYFPLSIWRLSALSRHVSGSSSVLGLLFWAAGRLFITPLAFVYLIGSVIRLYSLGALRRLGRLLTGRRA